MKTRMVLFAAFFLLTAAMFARAAGLPWDAEAHAVAAAVKRGLTESSTNFSAIRGKRIDSNRYFTTVAMAPAYVDCTIRDLSDGSMPDLAEIQEMLHQPIYNRWELDCRSSERSVSVVALADWLQHVVAPNLPPTLSHVTKSSPKSRVVLWGGPNGPIDVTTTVVAAESSAGSQRSSYEFEIEHVMRTARATRPPALSTTATRPVTAQSRKEAKAIADFVRLGLPEATTDFKRIRGKQLNPPEQAVDNPKYAAAVPFASAFRECTIELTGLWDFSCTSNVLSDASYEATVAFVKQAVAAGLPPGFVFQATPGDPGDLKWRGPSGLWVYAKAAAEKSRPYRPSYEVTVELRRP